jgi:hypothetical protein
MATATAAWARYSWAAGVVFVAALVAEVVIAVGIPVDHEDSASTIAAALAAHDGALIAIACLSAIYAAAFVVYLVRLHDLLRAGEDGSSWRSLILLGGMAFVGLHAVSDVGITGMLGAKVASYSAAHDEGISYTLYLLTFALDSVGDVFGSLFVLATGVLVLRSGALPRWLGWLALAVAPLFFLQGFGLGGVIALFGLVLDLIGFVLLLLFVLASSVVLLRRAPA